MNRRAMQLRKKKKTLWSTYSQTLDILDHARFARCRSDLRRLTRNLRKEYERKLAADIKQNPKAFWRYASSRLRTRCRVEDLLDEDGVLTSNNQGKADVLSKFFSSVFTEEAARRRPRQRPRQSRRPSARPTHPAMDQEQNQMQSAPQLCGNGCGFYGSPSFDGLCSKCHKDIAKSQADKAQQDQQASGAADLSQVLQETSALLAATTAQPTVSVLPTAAAIAAPPTNDEAESDQERTASSQEGAAASPADPSGKKKKSRCEVCRKKVGLTGFTCRCDGLFCSLHRYSDKHGCSFDYRVHGQQEIRKNNPVIVGEKVNKI